MITVGKICGAVSLLIGVFEFFQNMLNLWAGCRSPFTIPRLRYEAWKK